MGWDSGEEANGSPVTEASTQRPGQALTPLWGLLQFLESSSCTSEEAHTSGKRPGLGQRAELITMQQAGGEQECLEC